MLNVRMEVSGLDGRVQRLLALADTLIPDPLELVDDAVPGPSLVSLLRGWSGDGAGQSGEEVRRGILSAVAAHLAGIRFPPSASGRDSSITVPFVFQ